ncbi:MAG: hypothetical protein ACJASQ_000933 [Crocinitomicaceae bacterium]|jgi:hypothetical protein
MKYFCFVALILSASYCFSQNPDWVKTEGRIIEIITHSGRKTKETATVKFKLENGEELSGSVDLVRVPFIGSTKSEGDKITILYDRNNPGLIQSRLGHFLSNYGMYILIFLGVIFSIIPFLKYRKSLNSKA